MEEMKREVEYGKEKIQVVLQFPEISEETNQIKKEVSEILKKELQKQLNKGELKSRKAVSDLS